MKTITLALNLSLLAACAGPNTSTVQTAQSNDSVSPLWTKLSDDEITARLAADAEENTLVSNSLKYCFFKLNDYEAMRATVIEAPEFTVGRDDSKVSITLPMVDGSLETVNVFQTTVIDKELEDKFDIHTFLGVKGTSGHAFDVGQGKVHDQVSIDSRRMVTDPISDNVYRVLLLRNSSDPAASEKAAERCASHN